MDSVTLAWRWPAALGLLATAAVHIDIAPAHLREAPYAGVLFIALSVAAAACAVLLIAARHHPLAWAGAGALCLGALVAYGVSRSVGLPSLADDIGDWLNPLGVIAVAGETAVGLISAYVLSLGRVRPYRTLILTDRLYTVAPASPTQPGGYV